MINLIFQTDIILNNFNPRLTLSDCKDIATIAGVIVAGATLLRGLIEYSYQGKQKRAKHFFNLRKKLKENIVFKNICYLIDIDDKDLLDIPFQDKRDFLGLFEEIAIMKNSGLIKPKIAYYMFGYYAIKCWENKFFWSSVNKESTYWQVFRNFVDEAKRYDKNKEALNKEEFKI